MEVPSWINDYLPWAAPILTGSGGGFLGKRLADKRQDKKIKEIEIRLTKMEASVESNTLKDEILKEQFDEHKTEMKQNFSNLEKKIDDGQKWLLSEILKNMRA